MINKEGLSIYYKLKNSYSSEFGRFIFEGALFLEVLAKRHRQSKGTGLMNQPELNISK